MEKKDYPVYVSINDKDVGYESLEEAIEAIPTASVAIVTIKNDVIVAKQVIVPQANVTMTDGGLPVVIKRGFDGPVNGGLFVLSGNANLTVGGTAPGRLTIDGNGSAGRAFLVGLDEKDTKACLYLNAGVSVCGNRTDGSGSAALVSGKLVMNGADVYGNSSGGFGGAFHVYGNGDFRLYGGSVRDNSACCGGGLSFEGNAVASVYGGIISGNSVPDEGAGGNVYIAKGNQGVSIGGNILIRGGKRGNEEEDLALDDGMPKQRTSVVLSGPLTMGSARIMGKEVRFRINSDLGASVFNVIVPEDFTADERLSIFEGPHAGDQYGAFRFGEGRMFNDSENVRLRFYASPIKQSQWGDCTYIEFPDGSNMLIDCGKLETGEAIAKELWALGIHKIDICLLTHYHSDHANGFQAIFKEAKIKVGKFISSPYVPKTGYGWVSDCIAEYGSEKVFVSAGDSFDLGGAHFSVLWPEASQLSPVPDKTSTDEGGSYTDENPPVRGGTLDMNSKTLVVMLQYGENKVLFTGDIYANRIVFNGAQNWDYSGYDNPNSEQHLVEKYAGTDVLKADVMTAGHHGKISSNSVEIINAVSPSYAVAMGTADQKTVNQRYEEAGVVLFRTGSTAYDYSGTIGASVYVTLSGTDLTVETGR